MLRKEKSNKQIQTASRGRKINIILTAYCSCEICTGKWSKYNKTAMGTTPSRGFTVATPRNLLGKYIYIKGFGWRKAEDTGNKNHIKWIDKNTVRIDIYMGKDKNAHKRAKQFGVVKTTGYIKD